MITIVIWMMGARVDGITEGNAATRAAAVSWRFGLCSAPHQAHAHRPNPRFVWQLSALFRVNTTLEAVDLRSNGFGGKFDARALVASLRVNESISGALRYLDLRPGGTCQNRIGEEGDGMEVLKKYIRDHSKPGGDGKMQASRITLKIAEQRHH